MSDKWDAVAWLRSHPADYEFARVADELERARSIIEKQREALDKAGAALRYCSLEPRILHPTNNAQYCVAGNALTELDAALALTLDEKP